MGISCLRKLWIILLFTIFILAFVWYRTWTNDRQMARNYYGMYISSQYNLLNLLRDALIVKENRKDFINKLYLVKGEFALADNVVEHVYIPESLYNFHKRGEFLVNTALNYASQGKQVNKKISELEEYTKKLSQLVHDLNYSQVIDKESPNNIYKNLDRISKQL